jgi:hypothetical protein
VTFTAGRMTGDGDAAAESAFRAAFAVGETIYTTTKQGNALLIGDVTVQTNLSTLGNSIQTLRTTVTIAMHSTFITAYAADNSIIQADMMLSDGSNILNTGNGGTEVVYA